MILCWNVAFWLAGPYSISTDTIGQMACVSVLEKVLSYTMKIHAGYSSLFIMVLLCVILLFRLMHSSCGEGGDWELKVD